MKILSKLALLIVFLSPLVAKAQNPQPIQGWCQLGGIKVSMSGQSSTNTVMASYPKCLVTVYISKTSTLATIYSDNSSTPLANPFTASANAFWTFYALTGMGYDITLSGGTPISFPQPITLVNVFSGGGGGGGGGGLPAGTGIVAVTNGVGRLAGYVDVVNTFNVGGTCIGFLKSDGTCGTSSSGGAAGTILGQIQILGAGGTFDASAAIANKDGTVLEKRSDGYRQNPEGALMRSRDSVLQLTVTPQDFCPNAGSGNNEDSVCFNKAIQFLGSINAPGAVKTLRVPYTVNGYFFGATNYLINLPRDWGDYNGSAGFIRAGAVTLRFANGVLQSCTSSGMVGYTANAQIPVLITDSSGMGSGANANVPTDASGNSTGACTVTSPGMGYPSIGVQAVPQALGGDGAAGTVDLVSGVVSNPQLMAGGHGYLTGLKAYVPGLTNCTGALPLLNTTVSSATAAVTAFGITTGGTACQFSGNPNATGIPVAFGASCLSTGMAQCTLLPPEPPLTQACSVAVKNNVNIIGDGGPIIHTLFEADPTNLSRTQPVAFCDPDGLQTAVSSNNPGSTASAPNAYSMKISGLTIRGFVGFWFPGVVESLRLSDITFEGPVPWIFGSVFRTNNFIAGTPFNPTIIENSSYRSSSAGICGGSWTSRNPIAGAGGVLGGVVMGHPDNNLTPYYWGQCRNIQINNVSIISGPNAPLDTFFETNVWKTQNGPTTPGGAGLWTPLSNGSTTCPGTTTIVDRTTDFAGGTPYQGALAATYPYYMCYPGVSSGGFAAIPRFWDGNLGDGIGRGIAITTLNSSGTTRPALNSLNSSNVFVRDIYVDNGAGAAPPDPYLPGGQTRHAVSIFGTTKIYGSAQDILIARGFYADGLQVRQASFPSPFVNAVEVNNVFNVQNSNFPFPVIVAPTSTSPCQQGQFLADNTGAFIYFCVTNNVWRRAALSAF